MKNVTPGAWFTASVFIERTTQISSAIEPRCGSISLSSMPLAPHFLKGLMAGVAIYFA